MYRITAETIIDGSLAEIWAIAIDVDQWPTWDPHEQDARVDGEFAVGVTGWSKPRGGPGTVWTITEVTESAGGSRWSSECGLPGGKLTGENVFEASGDNQVRCRKTVFVRGPLVPLFRLYFGRRIRRDMARTFTALEAAARRGRVS